jgi:hypothetical protein
MRWRDVRFWHLADVPTVFIDVRFRGENGPSKARRRCRLMTQSGHQQLSQFRWGRWRGYWLPSR